MEGKKLALCVVLLAVVVGAVALAVKRVASNPGPPNWVMDQQVQKVDAKTPARVEVSQVREESVHVLSAVSARAREVKS